MSDYCTHDKIMTEEESAERFCCLCGRQITQEQEIEIRTRDAKSLANKKQIRIVDEIINYIQDKLMLKDSICNDAKYYYKKADAIGIPHRRTGNKKYFYLTETVGACILNATLLRGRKFKKGAKFVYYKHRNIESTPETICKELNLIIDTIRNPTNKRKYLRDRYRKEVTPDRIHSCARLLMKELRTDIKLDIPPIAQPVIGSDEAIKIRNLQHDRIDTSIFDVSVKLGLNPEKVLNKFQYNINKLEVNQILKTSNVITNKGHIREPKAVAAGFIYKVFRNKITIRKLKKAAGCGNKSLQKVLSLIT